VYTDSVYHSSYCETSVQVQPSLMQNRVVILLYRK